MPSSCESHFYLSVSTKITKKNQVISYINVGRAKLIILFSCMEWYFEMSINFRPAIVPLLQVVWIPCRAYLFPGIPSPSECSVSPRKPMPCWQRHCRQNQICKTAKYIHTQAENIFRQVTHSDNPLILEIGNDDKISQTRYVHKWTKHILLDNQNTPLTE